MAKKKDRVISQHVFELRYQAESGFFDLRGQIAGTLHKALGFADWRLSESRVEIIDKLRKNMAFVSYSNCGFVSVMPDSHHYFQDQAIKFLKNLLKFQTFSPFFYKRLGVRSIFVLCYEDSFQSLVDRVRSSLITSEKRLSSIADTKVTDIGVLLEFDVPEGHLKVSIGAAKKPELRGHFERTAHEHLPEIGLSADIDCYKMDLKNPTKEKLLSLVQSFATLNTEKFEKILALLME